MFVLYLNIYLFLSLDRTNGIIDAATQSKKWELAKAEMAKKTSKRRRVGVAEVERESEDARLDLSLSSVEAEWTCDRLLGMC